MCANIPLFYALFILVDWDFPLSAIYPYFYGGFPTFGDPPFRRFWL